jgi:hypothetical protein
VRRALPNHDTWGDEDAAVRARVSEATPIVSKLVRCPAPSHSFGDFKDKPAQCREADAPEKDDRHHRLAFPYRVLQGVYALIRSAASNKIDKAKEKRLAETAPAWFARADSGLGRALTAHQFYDVEDRSKCSLMNWTSGLSDLTGSPGGDRAYQPQGRVNVAAERAFEPWAPGSLSRGDGGAA